MNKRTLRQHAAAAALLSGLATAVVAHAEAAAPAPGSDSIQEVVVTARHQSEKLQDVPVSVQAISGKTLELKNTVSLPDIVAQTPGLFDQIGNPRNTSLAIRGIGVTSAAGDGLDNMVGVYFDGVYQGRPGMALQDLIDIDSFEVLRGPQGTLFGRNSEVGALNITTQRPNFTPSATFEATYGNYNFIQGKAILNTPINSKVASRTVLFGTYQDGRLNNGYEAKFAAAASQQNIYAPTATSNQTTIGSQGRYGVRQKFVIDASDKLTILIAGDYEQQQDSSTVGGAEINTLFGPGNWGPNTTAAQQAKVTAGLAAVANIRNFGGVLNWTPTVNPTTDISNSYQQTITTNAGASITADYNLNFGTLSSISAWRYWYFLPPQDSDFSPLDIYYNAAITKNRQWSEELRLTSNKGGRFEWQTGLYFFYGDLQDHYIVHQFGADVIPLYNALVSYGAVTGTPFSTSLIRPLTGSQIIENTEVKDKNAAAYFQGTWHITDKLSATGGARYTYDEKTGSSPVDLSLLPTAVQGAAVTAGATATLANYGVNGAASGYPVNASVSGGNLSGSASLSYKVTPDTLVYGSFSNGYQAAALNLNAVIKAGIPVVVQPSSTDNIEFGLKSSLFDHRLVFNLAAFWEVLYGYQTTYSQIASNGATLRYIANAGDVRTRGIEWDIAAALGHGVKLTFDGAYDDAVFQSAHSVAPPPEVTTTTFDATGKDAPDAPKVTMSLTPSWDYQISEHDAFYSYAQYSYSSSFYSQTNLTAYGIVPAQYTLNLRAGLRLKDGRYDVSVYANNATNQQNINAQNLLAIPATSIYIGKYQSLAPPAMYGVTFRAKY